MLFRITENWIDKFDKPFIIRFRIYNFFNIEKLDALEASVATLSSSSSVDDDRITESEDTNEELTLDIIEIEERLTSAESSITTLNSKSENLDVTLLTICNRIDYLSYAVEDPYDKYHCCYNPDLQKMICGSALAIDLGAVQITQGDAGQCLATDTACL